MSYQMIIGIETHIELKTHKKIFCDCEVAFGKEPNTLSCPICRGELGVKPKYNSEVTEYAIRAGSVLNCKINFISKFDRKHYISEDLPKGYQITQFYNPICQGGYLVLDSGKKINLKQIHLEEDVAKAVYGEQTFLDFNRSGIPLIEIVTEPNISSAEEAGEYVEKLQSLMKYAGVSDCKMNEGALRCDINISLTNGKVKGNRVEVKNLNSISNIKKAINSEYDRQSQILDRGESVAVQTLKFDVKSGKCLPMREKESSSDYGYISEPDLSELVIDKGFIQEVCLKIGELPQQKLDRFTQKYLINLETAKILCKHKKVAEFFEEVVKLKANPQTVAKLIVGTLFSKMTEYQKDEFEVKFTPKDMAKLVQLIENGYLFNNAQKTLVKMMQGNSIDKIVTQEDLKTITEEELMELCVTSVQLNSLAVEKYKSGNCKAINALVGYCMKASGGKVDAKQVENIIIGLIRE